MKVLRFMGYPIKYFGSLEGFVHTQALYMKKMGHDLEIVYDGVADLATARRAREFTPDIRVHFSFPNLVKNHTIATRISYFIRRGGFHIVHSYFSPSARILNYLSPMLPRVKFVRAFGSFPDISGEDPLIRRLKKVYLRANLYNYDMILCVAEHIKEALIDYGIKRDKLLVVHSVTDTSYFQRYVEQARNPRIFRMTFLGRLEPIKNIETLVKGVRLLVHKYEEKSVRLNIFGEGSQEQQLRRLVERSGLQRWIRFQGKTHEVLRILNEETDAYVQASHMEGFPASVREAMACQLPVVVSDRGGLSAVVEDGINGFLFQPENSLEFANKLLQLKKSHGLRISLGRKARDTIVKRFDVTVRINQEKDIYTKLLS